MDSEEDLPTFKEKEKEDPRIFGEKQKQVRQEGTQAQEEKGQVETRRLTRGERLRLKRDFKRVFTKGRSVFSDYVRLVYVENGLDHPRIAVVVRKKIGKAVYRNRLRRLVKEFYRLNKEMFRNYDVVVLFRAKSKDLKDAKLGDIEKILTELLEKMK